jgi:exopolyphosphatase/pppGpp-phosphohydrolase
VTRVAAVDPGSRGYGIVCPNTDGSSRPAGVERQLKRLAGLPLAERRTLPALDPDRAPVIVAGAVVLREAMSVLDLGELEASEHDLLHGAVLEAAEQREPVDGNAPAGAHACC